MSRWVSCGLDVAFFKIPLAGVAFDRRLLFDFSGWKLDSLDDSKQPERVWSV